MRKVNAYEDDIQRLDGVAVHAGFPNAGEDASASGLNIHHLLVKRPPSTFLMRLRGNEWEDRGIFDGDIVVIDRALDPRKIDLVIWWQGENFVISRFTQMPKRVQ